MKVKKKSQIENKEKKITAQSGKIGGHTCDMHNFPWSDPLR